MSWTHEKIASLAPDAATLARAEAAAAPRKWRNLGHNGHKVWGLARSSGANAYRCLVDLDQFRSYCSCPARKTPCKHILALLMLFSTQTGAFRLEGKAPEWVAKDLARLGRPPSALAEKEADKRRADTRERNRDQRLQLMREGAAELQRWLLDLVRQGTAQARQQPESFWEEMAARMVDAKLAAVGRRIRQCLPLLHADDWHDRLLEEIAGLYLFCRAFQRLDELPPAMQEDLLSAGGRNIKKENVLKEKALDDHWLIIGQNLGTEDNLNFRRTWLIGEKTEKTALLLDFAWGSQPYEQEWKVGAAIRARLAFYPGNFPLRALVADFRSSTNPFLVPQGSATLEKFAQSFAEAVAANPWIYTFPACLDLVVPVLHNNELLLVDKNRQQLPARTHSESLWKLLALSTGKPITVFGEWDGRELTVLSAVAEERIIQL